MLSQKNADDKLAFALKYRAFGDYQQDKIIWADEIIIHKKGNNSRSSTFRSKGQQWNKDDIDEVQRSSGPWVMCWAAIWNDGFTEIQFMDRDEESPRGGCSADSYIEMIADQLPQFYRPDLWFMQDNFPLHTAQRTRAWLAQNNINWIQDWPPYSPDLNPIKHIQARLRDELIKYKNGHGDIQGNDEAAIEAIKTALGRAWDDVLEEYMDSCFRSFVNRLDALIEAEGWYTKY